MLYQFRNLQKGKYFLAFNGITISRHYLDIKKDKELSWRSCLYIFEVNPLSAASFAIIFSQSEGCLFTLLIVSFAVQKLLSSIRFHCLFLLLFPIFWEVGHRGSCCDLFWRVFCLCSPLTHWGNQIWKRHMYPNVHHSTVYNSQDMEAT